MMNATADFNNEKINDEVTSSVNVWDIQHYLQRNHSDNLGIHGLCMQSDNIQSMSVSSLLHHALRAMEMCCSLSHIGPRAVAAVPPEDGTPHDGSVSFALALMIWNILYDANSNGKESLLACVSSPLPHSTFSPETETELSKVENASSSSGCDESADEELLQVHLKGHKFKVTKKIPRDIIYCRRVVRCELCPYAIKGPRCLDQLIQHTKQCHRTRATPPYLRLVRQANTAERLVGEGMPYCCCEVCTFSGLGALFAKQSTHSKM